MSSSPWHGYPLRAVGVLIGVVVNVTSNSLGHGLTNTQKLSSSRSLVSVVSFHVIWETDSPFAFQYETAEGGNCRARDACAPAEYVLS